MKRIVFFTTHYPQKDFQWKTDELRILSRNFNVEVIPYIKEEFDFKAPHIENITYQYPLIDESENSSLFRKILKATFSRFAFKFYREFIERKVYLSRTKILLWAEGTQKIRQLSRNQRLKEIFKNADANTILYFYWGRETSEALAFLPKTKAKIIVRFHGYDLYEYRHKGNYIAFRSNQLRNLDYAVFVSEDGKQYLEHRYPKINFNAKVFRLGTSSKGLAIQSTDNTFRIVSCSSVIPLKRVDLIAKALEQLDFKIEWTHIGAGRSFEAFKQEVKKLPGNIKVNLAGQVPAKDVPEFYVDKPVDLFINVSKTEGLPVSIMEAFAAGIPAIATNVGGTSELVNNTTGSLLSSNLSPKELARAILDFYNSPTNEKTQSRKNAFTQYQQMACFEKNIQLFINFIEEL